MSSRTDAARVSDSSLGGKWAVVLFVLALLAFVVESQFTQVRFLLSRLTTLLSEVLQTVCPNYTGVPAALFCIVCLASYPSYSRANNVSSYCVHSAFAIMFPLHYLYLVIVKRQSPAALKRGLRHALQQHVAPTILDTAEEFPTWGLTRLVVILSIIVSIPALLWFIAVTLAP